MKNDAARAAYWANFIMTRSEYPAPALLREQLAHATFADFCPCGCNSFGVRNSASMRPLVATRDEVRPIRHYAIFEADFRLADGQTIEVIIFANDEGNLAYIEVDCCGNSAPVPDEVVAPDRPFHLQAFGKLNKDP